MILRINDFPVIGDLSEKKDSGIARRSKQCKSLQRNVWRRVVSSLE